MHQTSKYIMTPLHTLSRQEAIHRIYVFQLLLQNELHKSKFGLCQTLLNMIFFEIFLQLLSQISMKNSINKNLPIRRCSLNKNSNSPAINLNQSEAPILFTKIDSTKNGTTMLTFTKTEISHHNSSASGFPIVDESSLVVAKESFGRYWHVSIAFFSMLSKSWV